MNPNEKAAGQCGEAQAGKDKNAAQCGEAQEGKDKGASQCGGAQAAAEQSGSFDPAMMMGMMNKMMGSGGEGPMAMMQKMIGSQKGSEAGGPTPTMMAMCAGMLTAMNKTTSMAAFATPELQTLFREWMESVEREALVAITDKGQMDVGTLAAVLNVSEESSIYLIAQLASKGKANLSIQVPGIGSPS